MDAKGFNFVTIQQSAMKVLTSPSIFFREMPKTGGFVEPLIFMVVMGVISGLLQTVFSIIGLRVAAGVAMGVASVIVLPIMIAIFGFVGAAILFVIWKLMGSQESYETAYRCGAYITVLSPIITVLGLIPYIGSVIGIIAYTFFLVIASAEVHSIPSKKAWLVFGIIGAILIVMSVSAQYAARKLMSEAGKFQKQMEETSKAMQKQTEEMQKQTEEAKKAAEEMQKELQR